MWELSVLTPCLTSVFVFCGEDEPSLSCFERLDFGAQNRFPFVEKET
jgi:hypothetical protein